MSTTSDALQAILVFREFKHDQHYKPVEDEAEEAVSLRLVILYLLYADRNLLGVNPLSLTAWPSNDAERETVKAILRDDFGVDSLVERRRV